MFVDNKSTQRVSKCSAIPASRLLKSILDRYRPDRNLVFYLNLYWTVIGPTRTQHSTQISIGPLSAPQESSILLKSILDRYRPDRNLVFYLNLYWTVIGPTRIQHSETQICIGPLSAPQKSSIYSKLYWTVVGPTDSSTLHLDRYRPDRNSAFYFNLFWTVIDLTGIQYST